MLERALDLDRAHDLAQLARKRARARLEQARDLHGQGRAAGDGRPLMMNCTLARSERQRIDAGMAAKAPVLVGEQQIEIARIDLVGARRQAPAAVTRCERPQQAAFAIEHKCRICEVLAERSGPERDDEGGRESSDNNNADRDRARDRSAGAATRRARSLPACGGGSGRGVVVGRPQQPTSTPHPTRCARRPPPQGGR